MFKLAVLLSLVAVACAAPGGLTSHIVDHGLGHIHAPNVVDHDHGHHVKVIAQPQGTEHAHVVHAHHHAPVSVIHYAHPHVHIPSHGHLVHDVEEPIIPHHQHPAPSVHVKPIVTKTVLPSHDHYIPVHHH